MKKNNPVIYDTLSRSLQPLLTGEGKTFRMYCCGPTVYGPAHIGNFRTFVLQDVLRRFLESQGVAVTHVRNITDVDDKTIRQSTIEGCSLSKFTSGWTSRFQKDCFALAMRPPSIEPGAVAHIPEQIALIEKLIRSGHAYESEGSVYFRVASFPRYGRLSRLPNRELLTGAGSTDADEYQRETASDFVLWKARKPEDGPNFWESPWGQGRPGWHIECSAMSLRYLGDFFDLHGGGSDLIFPHHENEIAQSEAATGHPFCRLWMHVEHLTVEGRKMSKSLGNLFTLDDARDRGFDPLAIRYVLMAGHYRKPLNFTWESVAAASAAIERLKKFARKLVVWAGETDIFQPHLPFSEEGHDYFAESWVALADDLNTPGAFGGLFGSISRIENNPTPSGRETVRIAAGLAQIMIALGLERLLEAATLLGAQEGQVPETVRAIAERRWQARVAKDWPAADKIRNELAELGWAMQDGRDGYTLKKKPL